MQKHLELRWQEMEMVMKDEKEKQGNEKKGLEAKNEEMQMRLEALADEMEEKED